MEGGQDDFLFWMNAQNIYFFQLPKLKKYCLVVELAPAHQVIKELKMDHLWVFTLYIPHHAATAAECDKKKETKRKKGYGEN